MELKQISKNNQQLTHSLIKRDKTIEDLQSQIDDLKSKNRQFLGKYDEKKILEEIKVLVSENQELKSAVREIKSELDYGK